jgi:ankyrin repeat protein
MLPKLHINEKVGDDEDDEGWYALELACRSKSPDILLLILTQPRVNLTLGNPFQEALVRVIGRGIRGSSWKIIEILLQKPFMPDQVNKISEGYQGVTPLLTAVHQKLYKSTELLCADSRTEVNAVAKDGTGYSALMIACRSGEFRMVHLLLRHPLIDVDMKDVRGNTALHLVVRHRDARCLRAFMHYFENHSPERKSLRMNVENYSGDRPLDIAIAASNSHQLLKIKALIWENGGRRGLPRDLRNALLRRATMKRLTKRIHKGFDDHITGVIGGFTGKHSLVETPTLKF